MVSFFFFRKMILDYFGEDSSSLEVRSNCCDNCEKGYSTWQADDIYVGFRNGLFNFTRDAFMLLDTIRIMEQKKIHPEQNTIILILRGADNAPLKQSKHFGKGKIRIQYYWNALMEQLTSTDYIEFVPGKTYLTLSERAHAWLDNPSRKELIQKPIGAIYRFFKMKLNTPLSNIQWNRNYRESDPFGKRKQIQMSSNFLDLLFGNYTRF